MAGGMLLKTPYINMFPIHIIFTTVYTFNRTDISKITKMIWGCSSLGQYQRNGIYQQNMVTAQVSK